MRDGGSSVGRVTSCKVNEIMESTLWAFFDAYFYILHYALPFEYVCRSVFDREKASDLVESVVVHTTGETSSAAGGDPASCGVQCF